MYMVMEVAAQPIWDLVGVKRDILKGTLFFLFKLVFIDLASFLLLLLLHLLILIMQESDTRTVYSLRYHSIVLNTILQRCTQNLSWEIARTFSSILMWLPRLFLHTLWVCIR